MTKSETLPHWATYIVVNLFRLVQAIVIVFIVAIIMAASIAVSLGKGSR
jgi:hypothetical protein